VPHLPPTQLIILDTLKDLMMYSGATWWAFQCRHLSSQCLVTLWLLQAHSSLARLVSHYAQCRFQYDLRVVAGLEPTHPARYASSPRLFPSKSSGLLLHFFHVCILWIVHIDLREFPAGW
jgi:hypothetical protein